mmetsp:Transcript_1634/g.3813  ORF Transcript_1634/g.3813 Transcript_1634/m.3813 type:complete len:213 (-) Transcript_1634:741-1379(-)
MLLLVGILVATIVLLLLLLLGLVRRRVIVVLCFSGMLHRLLVPIWFSSPPTTLVPALVVLIFSLRFGFSPIRALVVLVGSSPLLGFNGQGLGTPLSLALSILSLRSFRHVGSRSILGIFVKLFLLNPHIGNTSSQGTKERGLVLDGCLEAGIGNAFGFLFVFVLLATLGRYKVVVHSKGIRVVSLLQFHAPASVFRDLFVPFLQGFRKALVR